MTETTLFEQVRQLPGYQIKNSHFRIGSKLHIRDFYYAKRFFQNHFFASRFAFLLARKILDNLSAEDRALVDKKGLTLIGYGIYAELLMSLLEKFLRDAGPKAIKLVNHNLVQDSENLELIKGDPLLGCAIIVVPIASTFSTAVKIEASFKNISTVGAQKGKIGKKDIPFLSPHYNLLYVSDEQGEDLSQMTEMEKASGWLLKEPDQKRVTIEAFFEDPDSTGENSHDTHSSTRVQSYCIRLASMWNSVDDCSLCFPMRVAPEGADIKKEQHHGEPPYEEDLINERPLFETDRTSVTPISIFDFPKARTIDKKDREREFVLEPDMLRYGYHFRNHSHFFYRIDTEMFLRKNAERISAWLETLHNHMDLRHSDSDSILIIASCHYSNAAFINLVNETLFGSAANIVHFDPQKDYMQNFELVYGSDICAADKIIFVDDSLKTGATLTRIEEFVNYALNSRHTTRKADYTRGRATKIDACIFLINKSQHFLMHSTPGHSLHQKPVFAFAHLHLFTTLAFEEDAPLALEKKRYQLLISESFLDSLQLHFLSQRNKLDPERIYRVSPNKKKRHLLMLAATHRIYQYFSGNAALLTVADGNFETFAESLFSIRLPFDCQEQSGKKKGVAAERNACLLKVLTQSPFTQYEPLRKRVFRWVLELLDQKVGDVLTQIQGDKVMSYEEFGVLKFLIRRAGLMNSNYLISRKMLTLINAVFSPAGISATRRKLTSEFNRKLSSIQEFTARAEVQELEDEYRDRLRSLDGFHVFYCAQVKELLLMNEARCVKLQENITAVEKQLMETPAPGVLNSGFKQVVRILRTENAVVVQKFFEFLRTVKEWPTLYHQPNRDDKKSVDLKLEPIVELLRKRKVCNHPTYKSLQAFFRATAQDDPDKNRPFLDYLWVQYFIAFDKKKDLPLQEKTNHIFSNLSDILQFSGAFLIVQDSQQRYYLVYNRNRDDMPELDEANWNNKKDSLLESFLNGIPDASGTYVKTIMELKKVKIPATETQKGTSHWEDLYATQESGRIRKDLSSDFLPDGIGHLLLMRLSQRDNSGHDRIQGLVGFYYHTKASNVIDSNHLLYLILLRSSLGEFVKMHHKNSEFTDWRIAASYRHMTMLAGHGKHMLQKLAGLHKDLFLDIVLHMAHLQSIIMLDETSFVRGGEKNIKSRFATFYDVLGVYDLNADYFNVWLKNMAETLFDEREVECKVPCKVTIGPVKPSFSFAFSRSILNIIFFELFLNAKKNRWHFLQGEVCEGRTQNELEVAIRVTGSGDNRKLKLEITNTGPRVDDTMMTLLREETKNVKKDDATSGTALIKTILKKILTGADFDFESTPVNKGQAGDQNSLHFFKATIIVAEMNKQHGKQKKLITD